MDFSGAINWGDVVAEIVISDVIIENGSVTGGAVVFTLNGKPREYELGTM